LSLIRLISIIDKLLRSVSQTRKYMEEVRKKPEYLNRTMLLVITKSDGTAFMHLLADSNGIKSVVTPKPKDATVAVYVPFNIMVDLLDKKYDVDYALAKNWIRMESDTTEGWFYHYVIIRHFMKAMVEAV